MSDYRKQVNKEHYAFGRYYYRDRWFSYWHEANEILSRNDIQSVLDIGPGTALLKNILTTFKPTITYNTLDVAEDVHPDYVGSVTHIPVPDSQFDAVTAFQVLEHIKFEDFEPALVELNRVSRKYVFISLPHFGPSLEFMLKIPFLPKLHFATKIWYPKKHTFCGQHYWEVGKRGYSPKKIKHILQSHFDLVGDYVPKDNQYHHFYIMKKKI